MTTTQYQTRRTQAAAAWQSLLESIDPCEHQRICTLIEWCKSRCERFPEPLTVSPEPPQPPPLSSATISEAAKIRHKKWLDKYHNR